MTPPTPHSAATRDTALATGAGAHGSPMAVALAGLLSLAVAMGIGRFAFTPLLPMMLHDGVVTLPGASWLATANYLGYWLGAIACAMQPVVWARWRPGRPLAPTRAVRAGLVLTVALTLAMALPFAALWPLWRFMAGLASALVFVFLSGWCLARLAALGRPALGGVVFVGPGLGIAASGIAATGMVAVEVTAATGWAVFAGLAAVLTALAWPRLSGGEPMPGPAADVGMAGANGPRAAAGAPSSQLGLVVTFVLAYGLAGLGYIVTATFLPVIARQALPGGSIWLDLFWPLFGAAVAAGALLTMKLPQAWDRRALLVGCYGMQALGVVLTVWWPSLAGFALGSLLLGLPFTAITLYAMQEARRLRPHNPSALIGTLTAAWGLGQIAGPPLVAALLLHSASAGEGFERALLVATGALLLGAALFVGLAVRHPLATRSGSAGRPVGR